MKSKSNTQTKNMQSGAFLYLLPEEVSAKELAGALSYLNPECIEVWTQVNLLEVITGENTLTLEDMMDSLREADLELLGKLSMKQVYACDYQAADKVVIQKMIASFLEAFGGKLASDTEDFEPFLKTEEI